MRVSYIQALIDSDHAYAGTAMRMSAFPLALRRHRAPVGEAHTAIIALAGGPGQPALPFAGQFAELLGPIAATRDLIVFDQRGIGLSQELSCPTLQAADLQRSLARPLEACAAQLGPRRSFYTTADTVADIEAIRQAGGYEKLLLYGTSYGTKVAEAYAQAYPSHVEALVLDSVVTPNGTRSARALHLPSRAPRTAPAVRAAGVRAHHHRPRSGSRAGPRTPAQGPSARARDRSPRQSAHRHPAGARADRSPARGGFLATLRGEFLTAIAAAARGDTAALARLLASGAGGEEEQGSFDVPLYFATTCEEQDFPWSRAAEPRTRIAQAIAAARALPTSTYAPFSASDAIAISDVEACAHWPFTSAAPALDTTPFPAVPTLILSGADDLRTSTAGARELAAQIPGAHLLVVPYTGHSVLGDEPTMCAREAMIAMLSSHPIKSCRVGAPPASLLPPPLPPLRIGSVSSQRGYHGLVGRTLHAIRLTLADLGREIALGAGSGEGPSGGALRSGGLRAGWAQLTSAGLTLHGYSYVPGMSISGEIRLETASLQIGERTPPTAACTWAPGER